MLKLVIWQAMLKIITCLSSGCLHGVDMALKALILAKVRSTSTRWWLINPLKISCCWVIWPVLFNGVIALTSPMYALSAKYLSFWSNLSKNPDSRVTVRSCTAPGRGPWYQQISPSRLTPISYFNPCSLCFPE